MQPENLESRVTARLIVTWQISVANSAASAGRAKFDITATGQQRIVELIQIVIDAQGRDNPA